jgi:hypothetical protein
MTPLESRASSRIVTERVTPWRVKSPVASTWIVSPSAGLVPTSIGVVRVKVAVGKLSVSMPWRRSWPSRRSSSLASDTRFALISTAVTEVPWMFRLPLTLGVRPTAVFAPMVASCSCSGSPRRSW